MRRRTKYIIFGFLLFLIYSFIKMLTTTRLVQFKYKCYLLFWLPLLIITLIVDNRTSAYRDATGSDFFRDRYTDRVHGSNINGAILNAREDKKFKKDSQRNLASYNAGAKPVGIFFGMNDKHQYVCDAPKESGAPHVFVIGGSGSGKTQNIILPSIATWPQKNHIFALDISGDLTGAIDRTPGMRPESYMKLDLEDFTTPVHYDPFAAVRRVGNAKRTAGASNEQAEGFEEMELEKIAGCIVPKPAEKDSSNRYFRDGARTFCLAALVYGYFNDWPFGLTIRWAVDGGIMVIMNAVLKDNRKHNASRLSGFLGQNEKNLAGIDGELKQFAGQLVKVPHLIDLLSPPPKGSSDLTLTPQMLESHDVFIKCSIDQIANYSAVIGLLFSQFFDFMYQRPINNPEPILVICDELSSYINNIGVANFCDHVRNLRKHGIRIMMAVQDFSSLDAAAGEAARRTIWNNSGWQVVLLSRDPRTSRELSEIVGKEQRREYTRSTNSIGGSTISQQIKLEDVIPAEDFSTLVNKHKLILLGAQGYQILRTCPFWQSGQDLIQSGHHTNNTNVNTNHNHHRGMSSSFRPPTAEERQRIYRPRR